MAEYAREKASKELWEAVEDEDEERVDEILRGGRADSNWRNPKQGRVSLLCKAVRQGSQPIVALLLRHGANPNARDGDKVAALHVAAEEGFPDIVRLLLDHGALPDARNAFQRTPLHEAACASDKEDESLLICLLLIKHRANVFIKTQKGKTARSLAKAADLPKIVDMLMEMESVEEQKRGGAATLAASMLSQRQVAKNSSIATATATGATTVITTAELHDTHSGGRTAGILFEDGAIDRSDIASEEEKEKAVSEEGGAPSSIRHRTASPTPFSIFAATAAPTAAPTATTTAAAPTTATAATLLAPPPLLVPSRFTAVERGAASVNSKSPIDPLSLPSSALPSALQLPSSSCLIASEQAPTARNTLVSVLAVDPRRQASQRKGQGKRLQVLDNAQQKMKRKREDLPSHALLLLDSVCPNTVKVTEAASFRHRHQQEREQERAQEVSHSVPEARTPLSFALSAPLSAPPMPELHTQNPQTALARRAAWELSRAVSLRLEEYIQSQQNCVSQDQATKSTSSHTIHSKDPRPALCQHQQYQQQQREQHDQVQYTVQEERPLVNAQLPAQTHMFTNFQAQMLPCTYPQRQQFSQQVRLVYEHNLRTHHMHHAQQYQSQQQHQQHQQQQQQQHSQSLPYSDIPLLSHQQQQQHHQSNRKHEQHQAEKQATDKLQDSSSPAHLNAHARTYNCINRIATSGSSSGNIAVGIEPRAAGASGAGSRVGIRRKLQSLKWREVVQLLRAEGLESVVPIIEARRIDGMDLAGVVGVEDLLREDFGMKNPLAARTLLRVILRWQENDVVI